MTRKSSATRTVYGTPLCPANPEHGHLLDIRGMSGYWCPHEEHRNQSLANPEGVAPMNKDRWSLDELDALAAA